jgi:hypothetical protein
MIYHIIKSGLSRKIGSELSNSVLALVRLQNDSMEGLYVINKYVPGIDSLIWKYIFECNHICLVESIVITWVMWNSHRPIYS